MGAVAASGAAVDSQEACASGVARASLEAEAGDRAFLDEAFPDEAFLDEAFLDEA